jgi:hypothetical protein
VKPLTKLGVIFASVFTPYFAFVLWLALHPQKINTLPWIRLAMPVCFLASILVLSMAIRRTQKARTSNTIPPNAANTQNQRRVRSLRRLLTIYLVGVPLCVVAAFSQKDVPAKFALLGLIVPLLIIGILWRSLSRLKRLPSDAKQTTETTNRE